ncbi:MAG: glycerol-3-phosphate 1-O-acyltransferase PlsY [Robiginitomaculum sp.]|nr:glycerol-3-phosphate 1-O-acyltransferase PlsY [Robiginitomaculum sp.]MDQ7077463.1 glycerol-3-phosphate 1-O-acyltransferase PlsY [Robiginitomaculum sp.]
MPPVLLTIALIGGYFLGSIPFGVLLSRWFGLGDVRKIGSGNIGATNVLRTGRKDLALATLILDGGKSATAYVLTSHYLGPYMGLVAAVAALLGHCYPVWLGFRGGKGVATFFGAVFVALWPLGIACAAIWLLTAVLVRISSVAALLSVNSAPAIALALGRPDIAMFSGLMALVISIRHWSNIVRMMKGTEPRFGDKKR